MKYDRADSFKSDYRKLSATEREMFRTAVRDINEAGRKHRGKGFPNWPAHLRIKSVQGASGVLEMTWSFSGPDGRATLEIVDGREGPVMRWRRIGSHEIFRNP